MDNQNVIIFLDKIKKLIELGNKPQAIIEIETIIIQLEHQIRKKQGKIILPLLVPSIQEISNEKLFCIDTRKKQIEIINFINKRFMPWLFVLPVKVIAMYIVIIQYIVSVAFVKGELKTNGCLLSDMQTFT